MSPNPSTCDPAHKEPLSRPTMAGHVGPWDDKMAGFVNGWHVVLERCRTCGQERVATGDGEKVLAYV